MTVGSQEICFYWGVVFAEIQITAALNPAYTGTTSHKQTEVGRELILEKKKTTRGSETIMSVRGYSLCQESCAWTSALWCQGHVGESTCKILLLYFCLILFNLFCVFYGYKPIAPVTKNIVYLLNIYRPLKTLVNAIVYWTSIPCG